MTKTITILGTGREYDEEGAKKEFQERMYFIQKDMGYETKEEFEKDYIHDKYPVSLRDMEGLQMEICKELIWIWKYHDDKNTPVTLEHLQFSMAETIGRFEEAVEQRKKINEH